MSYDGIITMTGVDGSHWDLTGPNEGAQGVHMRIKPKKLFDAPVKTLWIKSAFGQKYQGAKPQRRDPVFAVQIHSTDIDLWEEIDSQFRMALGNYDDEFTLHYTTKNGTRSLKMRLLEEPTAYETADYEDRDPHVWGDSTLAISAAAAQPYWVGDDFVSQLVTTSAAGTGSVKVKCAGDVPSWPRWTITAPSIVRLPDYSWMQKLYGRALQDATRTYLVPQLYAGEDLVLDSNPDVEMFVAANNNLVGGRARGDGIRYPIARHTPETSVPVAITGGVVGTVVKVTIPQWFSRPFGVSI